MSPESCLTILLAGLLLNNLSVFHGCDIVFDSMDVPEAALDSCRNVDASAMVGSLF